MDIYVRVTERSIEGKWAKTIDLASMNADEPGKGSFTAVLPEVKDLARELGRVLFVESVINTRLRRFLERQGFRFIEVDDIVCNLVWDTHLMNADLNELLDKAKEQMQA